MMANENQYWYDLFYPEIVRNYGRFVWELPGELSNEPHKYHQCGIWT